MRFLPLALICGAGLAAAVPPAVAATDCGRINGGFELDIMATNVSCKAAKALVREWHERAVDQAKGPGIKYVGSYACRSFETDPQHVKVYCANGTRKVRFYAGP